MSRLNVSLVYFLLNILNQVVQWPGMFNGSLNHLNNHWVHFKLQTIKMLIATPSDTNKRSLSFTKFVSVELSRLGRGHNHVVTFISNNSTYSSFSLIGHEAAICIEFSVVNMWSQLIYIKLVIFCNIANSTPISAILHYTEFLAHCHFTLKKYLVANSRNWSDFLIILLSIPSLLYLPT